MKLASRVLLLVLAIAAGSSSANAAEVAADASPSARTWTARDLRIPAGARLSIGFHPDVSRAELTGVGGAYEVCQAQMDGTAGSDPGQSWPSVTGFDTCIRSDHGRVLLPSVVVPSFHVAFLVRGVDGAAVRFSRFRVRYVPADGFFAFAVPTPVATFSVVPAADGTIGVQPVARTSTAPPAGISMRSEQAGRRVPRTAAAARVEAGEWTFGPVLAGRPVTVTVTGSPPAGSRVAYLVRWD